jgi:Family of unknown function (DUF6493)
MSIDPQQLEAAVLASDVRQVRGLLRGATEADRRACAESLKSLLALHPIQLRVRDSFGLTTEECILQHQRNSRCNAARWAVKAGLAAGPPAPFMSNWVSPWEDGYDEFVNVLADRRQTGLAESVDGWLAGPIDRRHPDRRSWLMARRLVRLGGIARPAVPGYTTKMPGALYQELRVQFPVGRGEPAREAVCLLAYRPLDALLADPGLLDDEVWRLFEVPGAAPELAKCDGTWEEALATLSERGLLDRGRLLDACLDAFFKDFASSQVGWYATFHDRMAPTADEVAARTGKYIALLAANSAHGVSLAQRACDRLLAAARLPLAEFLAASPPLLLFPQKVIAIRQVNLLGKVAREPSLRAVALATMAAAFGHARLDVQEAALERIGEFGVPEGAQADVIAAHASYLNPALTSKAADLGLLAAPPAPAAASAGISPTPAPPGETPPPPVEDPAELIRLLTQLMEDAPDPLAVERALAGAVRLAALPESDRGGLGSPLVKRAEQLTSGRTRRPHALSEAIARLALAWACVPCPPPAWASRKTQVVRDIPAARALEAYHAIADGPAGAELLAEPSAADGSVHPAALLARLATWRGAPIFRFDMEVALLRLPTVDASFWEAWDKVHPASTAEARRAYQAGRADLAFGTVVSTTTDGLRRSRIRVLARITSDLPGDAGESRCWQLLIDDLPDPLVDPYFEYLRGTVVTGIGPLSPVMASLPLLCPWQPELAAAQLLRPLSACLAPDRGRAGPGAAAVTGLTRSSAPLGPIGHLALLTGLSSVDAGIRIAGADVWSQAALAGRIDPDLAADALVMGVTSEAFKLTRLADGLRHASRQPASAPMIARTLFASADRLVSAKSPNLHLLLELTREIGAAIALPESPESIVALAGGKGSTKLAAAARQLVKP